MNQTKKHCRSKGHIGIKRGAKLIKRCIKRYAINPTEGRAITIYRATRFIAWDLRDKIYNGVEKETEINNFFSACNWARTNISQGSEEHDKFIKGINYYEGSIRSELS